MAELTEFRSAVGELAREFGLSLDQRVVDRLAVHFELLLMWNRRMNLTRISDPLQAARFHYLESLLGSKLIHSDRAVVVDVGSGAGFPGLPLAALDPAKPFRLVEANVRRSVFLKEAARAMRLDLVVVLNERFQSRLTGDDDVIVARAVDRFEALLPELLATSAKQVVLWGDGALMERAEKTSWGRLGYSLAVPGSRERYIASFQRAVPRETSE